MKRFFFLTLCLIILTSVIFVHEGQSASAKGQIAIYTSVPQPIIDKIQNDFQMKYPDITLDVFRSGTSAVVTKLMTEKEAGEIMADLIWVAEPSTYEDFKAQDLLLQFTPEGAEALLAEMKDPEGFYYAGRLINMIVAYNTNLVSDPPKSWTDLLKSEYKGKIGFPTPLRSGAAEASVKTLVDAFGWKFFEDFIANGGKQVKNNSTARDMTSTGELSVGVFLDYMARGAKAKGSPIEYIWPEEGAIFIPSPVAIMKSSKNPGAAKVFVNYVLSKEGQEILVKLGNFIPVRPDVAPPAGAPALDKIKKLPSNWRAVREERQDTKDKWAELFGE